ncbi:hypothetical protein B0H63DRAFT_551337 [Podospora didyma]|uniref:Rhodopsin domain-containing protein n=1 Tax=Podospora didyma TaxID=330526 RepID=A0AAE0N716_9PEZI|nr:hypothetical protein B0H63DRAFT_551337 [Podospora didyma]
MSTSLFTVPAQLCAPLTNRVVYCAQSSELGGRCIEYSELGYTSAAPEAYNNKSRSLLHDYNAKTWRPCFNSSLGQHPSPPSYRRHFVVLFVSWSSIDIILVSYSANIAADLVLTPETIVQIRDLPVEAPPPGMVSNFVNPDSTAYQMYASASIFIALMVVFSLVRLVAILRLGQKTAVVQEVCYVLGLMFCIVCMCLSIASISKGSFGRHSWNVRIGDAVNESQNLLGALIEVLMPIVLGFVKISVLILYFRIFTVLRSMRITCVAGDFVLTALHLAMSITFAATHFAPSESGKTQLGILQDFVSGRGAKGDQGATLVLAVVSTQVNSAPLKGGVSLTREEPPSSDGTSKAVALEECSSWSQNSSNGLLWHLSPRLYITRFDVSAKLIFTERCLLQDQNRIEKTVEFEVSRAMPRGQVP